MATIVIKNVGHVKKAKLDLNKINVFMGPQSCGKSTVAKLISYCQWIEKRRLLDGEYKEDVWKQLLRFHHLDNNYFNNNSFFEYKSDYIKIKYSGINLTETIEVDENKISDYTRTKNIYIPAERNFVSVIPNLKKYNENNDNILNLVYDWFSAKQNIDKKHSLPVLNFGIDYYYQKGADLDMLILNKEKKEIPLNTGSSGLQSIIPLIVILEYLINNIYKEKTNLSVNEVEHFNKLIDFAGSAGLDTKTVRSKLENNRNYYHSTQFIIEEPEQNLFPETQRDLIYYILERLNSERNHSLTITTHSPYILYALNNCMLGYLIKDNMPDEEQAELLSRKSWINPDLVSVWEIEKDAGTVRPIKNSKTGTVSKHYFNGIMNDIMEEYYDMLTYLKLENNDKIILQSPQQ